MFIKSFKIPCAHVKAVRQLIISRWHLYFDANESTCRFHANCSNASSSGDPDSPYGKSLDWIAALHS